jgi:predicted exporter
MTRLGKKKQEALRETTIQKTGAHVFAVDKNQQSLIEVSTIGF